MSANGFAIAARQEKAIHFADLLQAYGYKSYNVAAWDMSAWTLTTDAANAAEKKKDPAARKMGVPSVDTQNLIIKMLRDRELAACPAEMERR